MNGKDKEILLGTAISLLNDVKKEDVEAIELVSYGKEGGRSGLLVDIEYSIEAEVSDPYAVRELDNIARHYQKYAPVVPRCYPQ